MKKLFKLLLVVGIIGGAAYYHSYKLEQVRIQYIRAFVHDLALARHNAYWRAVLDCPCWEKKPDNIQFERWAMERRALGEK